MYFLLKMDAYACVFFDCCYSSILIEKSSHFPLQLSEDLRGVSYWSREFSKSKRVTKSDSKLS